METWFEKSSGLSEFNGIEARCYWWKAIIGHISVLDRLSSKSRDDIWAGRGGARVSGRLGFDLELQWAKQAEKHTY